MLAEGVAAHEGLLILAVARFFLIFRCTYSDFKCLTYYLNRMEEERVHSKLAEIAHACTRFDLSVHT
jgi:hypothetical protein